MIPAHRKALFIIFFVVVIVDQITKIIASQMLDPSKPIEVIPGVFQLTLVHNPGAAFGMFSTWSPLPRRLALGVVSLVAIGVVFLFLSTEAKEDRVARWALAGILGGAVGNVIDRMRFDHVIDFLDFYWRTYHWPAFNVADSVICVGVAVLVFRFGRKKETSAEAPSAGAQKI